MTADVTDVELASDLSSKDQEIVEEWQNSLAVVPPPDVRCRLFKTRPMVGKQILSYIGDAVWEYLVLRHQYNQVARSPFMESQAVRTQRQAKAAGHLWRGSLLTPGERKTLKWGMTQSAWRDSAKDAPEQILQVGYEQFATALGLRALLGYLYIDRDGSDERLALIAHEIGLTGRPGLEDDMLKELTGGIYDAGTRPQTTYFLALAPLGHVALRLYISRYFCERPPLPSEFLYRVKLALRQEELDLAAAGFMRDDATAQELRLMRGARDRNDTFAFAFECLLGHLALTAPYRLHQIVASFGWAQPLPGT